MEKHVRFAGWDTFDRDGKRVPVPLDINDAIDALMEQSNLLDYSTEQLIARAIIEDRARRQAGAAQ